MKNSSFDISIIIPTFNRYHVVTFAIDSAIAFLQHLDLKGEIIVVDDGSTDNTYRLLLNRYKSKTYNHHLSLLLNPTNIGVTKTRNRGVLSSRGRWMMFLDSDDQLIQSSAKKLWRTVLTYKKETLFLFRAEDMHSGRLVGEKKKKVHTIDLKEFLNNGPPGECLPVVRNDRFRNIMFYEPLFAGEGYTWARVIQSCGSAVLSPLVVRRYRTNSTDRLSARRAVLRRSNDMSLYNWLMLKTFPRELALKSKFRLIGKAIMYSCIYRMQCIANLKG